MMISSFCLEVGSNLVHLEFSWFYAVFNLNRNLNHLGANLDLSDSKFKKRFVTMLMGLSDSEWEFLEKKAKELAADDTEKEGWTRSQFSLTLNLVQIREITASLGAFLPTSYAPIFPLDIPILSANSCCVKSNSLLSFLIRSFKIITTFLLLIIKSKMLLLSSNSIMSCL